MRSPLMVQWLVYGHLMSFSGKDSPTGVNSFQLAKLEGNGRSFTSWIREEEKIANKKGALGSFLYLVFLK